MALKLNFSHFNRALVFGTILVACILFVWLVLGRSESTAAENKFVKVEKGSIEDLVIAQGKVEPKQYVDVGVQVSGQLKKIYADIGAEVKKGDLLAEIDPTVYKSQVDVAKARKKTLEAQLVEQEAQVRFQVKLYERNQKLHLSQATSKEVLEESQTALEVAEAKVASIKAQLEEAQSTLAGNEANLSYTKIFAPMDGTVVAQIAREGQTLNANQLAPIVLQLADLNTMTVRAQVAEADVTRLSVGMPVYFTILGNTERRWNATIRQILPSPELINDVVLYNALVDVENKDGQLMSGMSTQLFFVVAKSEDAQLIPIQTLGKRLKDKDSASGKAYDVQTRDGEKIVHVGIMNRSMVEIKDGLSIDDEVERRPDSDSVTKASSQPRMRPPVL